MRGGPQLRVHTIHLKVQSGQQYKNQTPSGTLLVGERTTSTPVKSLHFARNPIKTRPHQTAKGGAGHFFGSVCRYGGATEEAILARGTVDKASKPTPVKRSSGGFHLRTNEKTSNDALKRKRQATRKATPGRPPLEPGKRMIRDQQRRQHREKNQNKSQIQKHTLPMKSTRWAYSQRKNRVLPASSHSVTHRDALMSRGGRLAFPVRSSRFRPPLRYLGHSSSKSQNQNQNQNQVHRGRRVEGATEAKRSSGAVTTAGAVPPARLLIRTVCGG